MTERPPADHHPLEVSFTEAPAVVDGGAPVHGGAGVVFRDVDHRVRSDTFDRTQPSARAAGDSDAFVSSRTDSRALAGDASQLPRGECHPGDRRGGRHLPRRHGPWSLVD